MGTTSIFQKDNISWCQLRSDHQEQEVFWGNWALEAVEASKVAEAAEVNEAGEVFKA